MHPADHAGVLISAILGAEQMVVTGLRCLEPDIRVLSRHHVALDSKCRYIEAVNYILTGHGELSLLHSGDVQLVNLTLALGRLHLPHPLAAHDVNLHGAFRWNVRIEV